MEHTERFSLTIFDRLTGEVHLVFWFPEWDHAWRVAGAWEKGNQWYTQLDDHVHGVRWHLEGRAVI